MYLMLTGLSAGFISAALGIGGGVILVPAFIFIFGYSIHKAIGSSLATMVPAACVGLIAHYVINSGNVALSTAFFILIGSLFGAKYGARVAHKISGNTLSKLFAVVLLLVGLKLARILNIPTHAITALNAQPLLIILGLGTGFISSLFGIGGGVIIVPGLTLFFGFPIHESVATSLAVVLPTTFMGAMHHKKFNQMVNFSELKSLIPASLIGAILGAITANLLPAETLQIIFGIFMIMFAAKMAMHKDK